MPQSRVSNVIQAYAEIAGKNDTDATFASTKHMERQPLCRHFDLIASSEGGFCANCMGDEVVHVDSNM